MREGVLTHTMLTHTILTHTVLTVGVLWPALAHGACGGPAPSAAAGPKGLQQPAKRETASSCARRLARSLAATAARSSAFGNSTSSRQQQQQHRRRGRRQRAAAAARACVTATTARARRSQRRPKERNATNVTNRSPTNWRTTTWARAAAARRRCRARLRGVARSPKRAARGGALRAHDQVGSEKTARHSKHQHPNLGLPPSSLAPRRESLRESSCVARAGAQF